MVKNTKDDVEQEEPTDEQLHLHLLTFMLELQHSGERRIIWVYLFVLMFKAFDFNVDVGKLKRC